VDRDNRRQDVLKRLAGADNVKSSKAPSIHLANVSSLYIGAECMSDFDEVRINFNTSHIAAQFAKRLHHPSRSGANFQYPSGFLTQGLSKEG
jgi:hypothetical protein